jgi:glycosyltransferase involved in cell wall biosynthesis
VWFLPFVAESDLPRLYQNAVALLYPTLYEGFGLPALEAQAVGTPAVFSPVSSLPEVAGPAAVLVPPTDMAAWRTAVAQLIEERLTACAPREESRLWARQFSWAQTAAKTVEIYKGVARSSMHNSQHPSAT